METLHDQDNENDKSEELEGIPLIKPKAQEKFHRPSTENGIVCCGKAEADPQLGDNDSWGGPDVPQAPAEYLATGPWFVLVPQGIVDGMYDKGKETTNWRAERFDNADDANDKAIELVRTGHPLAYIGRALFEVILPVQMTQLIERKPTPPQVQA